MRGLSQRYFKSHFLPFLPAQAAGRWPEVMWKFAASSPRGWLLGWEHGAIAGSLPDLSALALSGSLLRDDGSGFLGVLSVQLHHSSSVSRTISKRQS